MSLFHHISFTPIDPLGDGLGDEIEHEQLEPEAITLDDDNSQLVERWKEIEDDLKNDPEWFTFSDE